MLSKKQKQNTLDEADFVRDVDKSASTTYLIVRLLVIRPVRNSYPAASQKSGIGYFVQVPVDLAL
jgi:hypothetical protein